jgi:hypothetical protein
MRCRAALFLLTSVLAGQTTPSISGRVVDENQNPAAHVSVWLVTAQILQGNVLQRTVGPTATDEDGRYSFNVGLEANRRDYVLVERPPAVKLVAAAAEDLANRGPIEVTTFYPSATRILSCSAAAGRRPLGANPGSVRGGRHLPFLRTAIGALSDLRQRLHRVHDR